MKAQNPISVATLRRLPMYLSYLKSLPKDGPANISATVAASALSLNEVQVRKDFAAVGEGGKPKIGYITEELIADIENCLGRSKSIKAILVGAGNLGRALLCCDSFSQYGLTIEAAFDCSENIIGSQINGLTVEPMEKMEEFCRQHNVRVGILTVPERHAQEVCDRFVENGIHAIWNFALIKLRYPENVTVLNEHIGSSLPLLLQHTN